jgi:hypothetical protein
VRAEEREALAEMALLYGTFIMGRFAEVMSSDQEPADDWQEQAAREAVDLFAPGARQMFEAAAAKHRDEWASYIENWSAAVGPEPPTAESIIAALRLPTPPFGVAAATAEPTP